MDIIKVNEMVGEDCKRLLLKEAAKAQFAAAVTAEASIQVENYIIDKEEEELDEQYAAIKINYKTEVIGEA